MQIDLIWAAFFLIRLKFFIQGFQKRMIRKQRTVQCDGKCKSCAKQHKECYGKDFKIDFSCFHKLIDL